MIAIGSRVQLHLTRNGVDLVRTGRLENVTDNVVVILKDDGKYGSYKKLDINLYVRA